MPPRALETELFAGSSTAAMTSGGAGETTHQEGQKPSVTSMRLLRHRMTCGAESFWGCLGTEGLGTMD